MLSEWHTEWAYLRVVQSCLGRESLPGQAKEASGLSSEGLLWFLSVRVENQEWKGSQGSSAVRVGRPLACATQW